MSLFEIDITVEDDRWLSVISEIEELTNIAITKVLDHSSYSNQELEVSVVLADDELVQNLNKTYRDKDKPTNVLSFPQTEDNDDSSISIPFINLGDIIIAYETICAEANHQNKSVSDHYTHMLVHGCLHLLHYDHQCDESARVMESLEVETLNSMDIKNPYEIK